MELNSQSKRLFSETINAIKNNDIEFLISTGNFILLIKKDLEDAVCYKRIEKDGETQWKERTDNAKIALNKLNLDFFQDEEDDYDDNDNYDNEESSSKVDILTDRIKNIDLVEDDNDGI